MAATTKTKGLRLAKRDRDVYDRLHLGWRAGYISDFYCGRRSPSDPTIVWRLDDEELAHDQRDVVLAKAEALRVAAGVERVEIGPAWCGFPSLVVHYSDGRSRDEHFDLRIRNTFTRADETPEPVVHGVDEPKPAPRPSPVPKERKGKKVKVPPMPKMKPEKPERVVHVRSTCRKSGVDDDTKARIVKMRDEGATWAGIATAFGINVQAARRAGGYKVPVRS